MLLFSHLLLLVIIIIKKNLEILFNLDTFIYCIVTCSQCFMLYFQFLVCSQIVVFPRCVLSRQALFIGLVFLVLLVFVFCVSLSSESN